MAYIGKTPITGNFVKLDAISVVNGQAGYTMNNGGSAFTDYENVNQFLVSLNGILQAPTDSFTVSGSTLTFASNLSTGDVIDFVIVLGNTLDIGTPSDATVTQAKTNFVSTSSSAGLQIKGDGTTDGTLQLNCRVNSHGIKLKSPPHSAGQSYTLTFPSTAPQSDKALITDGSGNLSFGDAGGGKIAQVVSTTKTDTYTQSVSSGGDSSIITGLTVDITPSATTSKILIFANLNISVDGSHGIGFQLFRDSTQIDLADASSSSKRMSKGKVANSSGGSYSTNLSTNHLDTPSTTSQITYGVKINHTSSSSKSMKVNRTHDDPGTAQYGRGTSTITAMEVLA